MTRIILESKNYGDLLLIKELAERLKIEYRIQNISENENNKYTLEDHFKLIDKGVDVSNFGDPSQWQKRTREDRI